MSEHATRLAREIERIGGVTHVAKQLGAVRNTIYNWLEKGNIPLNKLVELEELGADILFVLTGEHAAASLAGDEQLLLQAYRTLDPSRKAGALGAVAGLQHPAKVSGSIQNFNAPITGGVAARDIVNKGRK